jgi:hypothetical protein
MKKLFIITLVLVLAITNIAIAESLEFTVDQFANITVEILKSADDTLFNSVTYDFDEENALLTFFLTTKQDIKLFFLDEIQLELYKSVDITYKQWIESGNGMEINIAFVFTDMMYENGVAIRQDGVVLLMVNGEFSEPKYLDISNLQLETQNSVGL